MILIEGTEVYKVDSPLQRIQDIKDEIAELNILHTDMLIGGEYNTAEYILDEIAVLMEELVSIQYLSN